MAAWAADSSLFSTLEAPSLPSSPLVTVGYVMQLFFSLAIIAGLIYLSAKYLLPKLQPKTRGRLLEVADRLVLEPQVTAYVLKAKSKAWLIVVSSKHVARIDSLEGDFS